MFKACRNQRRFAVNIFFVTALSLAGCGAQELKKSLSEVSGKNIEVIRSYPTGYTKAINGNQVYAYSRVKGNAVCDIFFEVDKQNTIVKSSWKGDACNSFYNETLKPE